MHFAPKCVAFAISLNPQVKPRCSFDRRKLRTRKATRDEPRSADTSEHTGRRTPATRTTEL